MKTAVAHFRKSDSKAQSVLEHLIKVSETCKKISAKIGVPEAGELLGLLHDLGKYSEIFQSYIQSATGLLNPDIDDEYVDADRLKGKIDHSTAGAQWVWQQFERYGPQGKFVGQILALCLMSHHSGLIDCLTPEGENGFYRRIQKPDEKTHYSESKENAEDNLQNLLDLIPIRDLIQKCVIQIQKIICPNNGKNPSEIVKHFNIGIWTRLLFSCLIDADRIDSADFENPGNKNLRQNQVVDWEIAIDRLEKYLGKFEIKYKIDEIRSNISNVCKMKARGNQGIYSLTVPTGGGKTLASIRFALNHAKVHELDRIFYVIPYTSIIEQNAQVIRTVLEKDIDEFPWVLEHHSNLEPEVQTWRYKLVSENWDAPIIFTTMVQFLETLFSGGTRGARRMHQLANSVVIFDEIQTLPIKCVHLFCNAINFLTTNTKTTAVLCTATQPLLNQLKRGADKGQLEIPEQNELIEDVGDLFNQLKRVTVNNRFRIEGWSEPELVDLAVNEFEKKKSCLVIVNTKKWTQRLFELSAEIVDKDALFHLSTSLCPAHRKKILDTVRDRLDKNLPVLCVSTQLIEAGVDVDFASVIRFLAGLDSIAQAAGRCNRNGKWAQATVHVVNPRDESIDMLKDIKTGRDKALRILSEKEDANLLDPDVMSQYFSYYFFERADEMDYPVTGKQASRTDSLLNLLGNNPKNIYKTSNELMLKQSFQTAGKIFKAIDAPTESVIVPYEEGQDIIAELCSNADPKQWYSLLRRAQKFSVNVFPNVMKRLRENMAVYPVQPGESIFYLDERHYSQHFGLSVDEVEPMNTHII